MKKKIRHTKMVFGAVLGALVIMVAVAMMAMGGVINELRETELANEAEMVLTSAAVDSGNVVLPVEFFDQKQDPCVDMYDVRKAKKVKARQFEWASCGYNKQALEQGMVEWELDAEHLPVAKGGRLLSNRGLKDMKRWFDSVEGKSKRYPKTLDLTYENEGATRISYGNEEFYPLDEEKFSKGDAVNTDGHNHLFTMSLAIPFVVQGEESFEVMADDDTFVYVGDKLVLDTGGIHEAMSARFQIMDNGEVYAGVGEEELAYSGVRVESGNEEVMRIFHADRDARESVFKMEVLGMNINATRAELANNQDGVQVAMEDTEYAAPLGVSKTTDPSAKRGQMIIITTAGVLVVVVSVLAMMVVRVILREK